MGVMKLVEHERDLRGRHDHADEDVAVLPARSAKKNVELLRDVEHRDVDQDLAIAGDGEWRTMSPAPHGRQGSAYAHERQAQERTR